MSYTEEPATEQHLLTGMIVFIKPYPALRDEVYRCEIIAIGKDSVVVEYPSSGSLYEHNKSDIIAIEAPEPYEPDQPGYTSTFILFFIVSVLATIAFL